MSTLEDREWDAERDARTVHGDCGQTLDRCHCPDDEPERPILCDPHQQLLDAVDANTTGTDLDGLADALAHGCDWCEEA